MRSILTGVLCSLIWVEASGAQDSAPPLPPAPPAPALAPSVPGPLPVSLPSLPLAKSPRPAVARPRQPTTATDVDQIPVLRSIPAWYYPRGKVRQHARVVFRAVIDTMGRIEPESLHLISTTDTSFVTPARLTLLGALYRPGVARGERVRVMVHQALKYDYDTPPGCEVNPITPMLPPKC